MESVNNQDDLGNFEEPAGDLYEPEPVPPTKKPDTTTTTTKERVISIEPEYSVSSNSNEEEDPTEPPLLNFITDKMVEAEPEGDLFEPEVVEPEVSKGSFIFRKNQGIESTLFSLSKLNAPTNSATS